MKKKNDIDTDGEMYNPPHPGESLLTLYIEPLGLTIKEVSERMGVERKSVSRLINGHTSITAEMAVRLGMAFSTSAELWLNKQRGYDLWHAKQRLHDEIINIQPFIVSAISNEKPGVR
ncbi:MAG: HigA family addiction module antitoxin [Rickettsiales bacterium]